MNEDTDCGNSNSVCQASGAIGDATTGGACIPDTTFTAASDCPSGTFAMDQGDGTFRCVPPSGIECNGVDFADDGAFNLSNIGSACSFEHNGDTLTGKCFGSAPGALACVATCDTETVNADGTVNEDTDCGNSNSVCQASGAIGDAATFGACIPGDTFTAASDCPSGTFAVDKGDGTFRLRSTKWHRV